MHGDNTFQGRQGVTSHASYKTKISLQKASILVQQIFKMIFWRIQYTNVLVNGTTVYYYTINERPAASRKAGKMI